MRWLVPLLLPLLVGCPPQAPFAPQVSPLVIPPAPAAAQPSVVTPIGGGQYLILR